MNTVMTRITKGSLRLPKELQDQWENIEVVLYGKRDEILIKKKKRSLNEMLDDLNTIGKKINKKHLGLAIRWARKKEKA